MDKVHNYTEQELVSVFTWWRDTWHCRMNGIPCPVVAPIEDWEDVVVAAKCTDGAFASRIVAVHDQMRNAQAHDAMNPTPWHGLCVEADRLEPPVEQGYTRGRNLYPMLGEVHSGSDVVEWRLGWKRGRREAIDRCRPFDVIQYEIGAWSQQNFGKQESKVLFMEVETYQGNMDNHPVPLGSLAPLLGLCEEVAEMYESKSPAVLFDSIGDIAIYLCDYACREGFTLPQSLPLGGEDVTAETGLVCAMGKLCRATLKRHQGIRGFDNFALYASTRLQGVTNLLCHLRDVLHETFPDIPLLLALNHVWDNVVIKRNWVAAPANGDTPANVPATAPSVPGDADGGQPAPKPHNCDSGGCCGGNGTCGGYCANG